MKRVLCVLLALLLVIATLCACAPVEGGRQVGDLTYTFEYAYVALPNGETVEGKPTSWIDYENSDTIQVVINGKTYLTHYTNVVLVSE
jgi:hypothetical protein